jgi:hypothetical protein
MYQDDQVPRSLKGLPSQPEVPLSVGDVIARTPKGVLRSVSLFPAIGLNRPNTDHWPVLTHELGEISHWVRTQAVPLLVTGSASPEADLPARYDIAVGLADERQAMAAGSTVSAADRHKQHLVATSAREHFADIIGRMEGAPSNRRISLWLAHLTDEEVLDRASELQLSQDNDPVVMLRNIELLKGLRDEASRFGHDDQAIEP